MIDTPLADLIQSFCISLSEITIEIRGIAHVFQNANEKLHQESLTLVTKNAGQVSFAGLGASAFFVSVQQNVREFASVLQTLNTLSIAASQCHDALTTQSSHSDMALFSTESALSSYLVDLSAVYGQATYPYTYLIENAIVVLDLNSVIQQGSAAVAPSFQSASLRLIMLAQSQIHADPTYQDHVARAITAVNLLTEEMQRVCEYWATQVQMDVITFTNAAMSVQNGEGKPYGQDISDSNTLGLLSPSLPILTTLLATDSEKGKDGGDPPGIDIGPLWEGSWKSQTPWQQSSNLGSIPFHNVGTVNIFDYEAGAHIGEDKKGGFDTGLILGGDIFDWGDQALLGTTAFGLTFGGDVKGPAADASIGINKDSLGADLGLSAATVNGDFGLNIAGANVGVTGSAGAKIELGFEIGAKTELKLPFVSLGFSVGKAQTGMPG